jgi:hypothetical protein
MRYSHINRLRLNQTLINLLNKKNPWCGRVRHAQFVCEVRTKAEEAVDHSSHNIMTVSSMRYELGLVKQLSIEHVNRTQPNQTAALGHTNSTLGLF